MFGFGVNSNILYHSVNKKIRSRTSHFLAAYVHRTMLTKCSPYSWQDRGKQFLVTERLTSKSVQFKPNSTSECHMQLPCLGKQKKKRTPTRCLFHQKKKKKRRKLRWKSMYNKERWHFATAPTNPGTVEKRWHKDSQVKIRKIHATLVLWAIVHNLALITHLRKKN